MTTDRHDDIFAPAEDLLFADETAATTATVAARTEAWKLVIADDDEEVHALTRLVLSDFTFEGRGLEFVSAYSGKETVEVLREHTDAALVLLDVVMESDDAGLKTAKAIREELQNGFVRIILRTGQPGQAPEQEVVSSYDINDYKAKTELTAQKLSTTVTSALRSYRDIRTIERHRQGMETVNALCRELYTCTGVKELGEAVLEGVGRVLAPEGSPQRTFSGVFTERVENHCIILAGAGDLADSVGRTVHDSVGEDLRTRVNTIFDGMDEYVEDDLFLLVLRSPTGFESRLIVKADRAFEAHEIELLGVYVSNARTAFANIHLDREVRETQREMILTLGEVVESRSKETANHVKRVGRMARRLGELAGLDTEEARLLEMAAPLHDIGKIAIPDAVLLKPGRFTPEERAVMERHAEIGREILSGSSRELFRIASVIAHEHHEKWDGSGYPRGLTGEDIHIHGRIVAIVDVFDALAHERCYKPAMPLEKCLAILQEGSGNHFDPGLIDLFMANVSDFTSIMDELRDEIVDEPDVTLLEV